MADSFTVLASHTTPNRVILKLEADAGVGQYVGSCTRATIKAGLVAGPLKTILDDAILDAAVEDGRVNVSCPIGAHDEANEGVKRLDIFSVAGDAIGITVDRDVASSTYLNVEIRHITRP